MLKSSIALAVLLSLAAAGCKSEPTSEKASSLTPAKATETAPAEFKARGPTGVRVRRHRAEGVDLRRVAEHQRADRRSAPGHQL